LPAEDGSSAFLEGPANGAKCLFGYIPGEQTLPDISTGVKEGVEIKIRNVAPTEKRAVAVTIGGGTSAVPPHPDIKSALGKVGGVMKRAACKTPVIDRGLLNEMRSFTRQFVREVYVPLLAESNINVQDWLKGSSYPLWRQEQLMQTYETEVERPEVLKHVEKLRSVQSFVKSEFYATLEYKWPRIINARCDAAKTVFGPYISAVEHAVYGTTLPGTDFSPFIKHIPVAERPRYMMRFFSGLTGQVIATDYTTFEASFVKELMSAVEFELYDWMLSSLPEHDQIMQLLRMTLLGRNKCDFRDLLVSIDATRMSGEMCTSLGNGFSNLVFMHFACSKMGSTCLGFIEGDDGLFVVDGPVPTTELFSKMGLVMKLEKHDDIAGASFCGMIFDPEELEVIADPKKILATTPWLPAQYAGARLSKKKALLRCKALSLAAQYPCMPIISAYSRYLLRATRGQSLEWALRVNGNDSTWRYKQILHATAGERPVGEPGPRTRALMEKSFGVPVSYQLYLESYFDSLVGLVDLSPEIVGFIMPDEWKRNYVHYVRTADPRKPVLPCATFATNDEDLIQMLRAFSSVADDRSIENLQNHLT